MIKLIGMGIKRIKWTTLFWLGTSQTSSYEQAKRIVLLNQLSFFFSIIALGYMALFYLINAMVLLCIISGNAFFYIVCLVLNKRGLFKVSWFVFLTNLTVAIYLGTAILGPQVSGQFFLVFLFPLSTILFDKTQKFLKWYCLLLPIVAFCLLEV